MRDKVLDVVDAEERTDQRARSGLNANLATLDREMQELDAQIATTEASIPALVRAGNKARVVSAQQQWKRLTERKKRLLSQYDVVARAQSVMDDRQRDDSVALSLKEVNAAMALHDQHGVSVNELSKILEGQDQIVADQVERQNAFADLYSDAAQDYDGNSEYALEEDEELAAMMARVTDEVSLDVTAELTTLPQPGPYVGAPTHQRLPDAVPQAASALTDWSQW